MKRYNFDKMRINNFQHFSIKFHYADKTIGTIRSNNISVHSSTQLCYIIGSRKNDFLIFIIILFLDYFRSHNIFHCVVSICSLNERK